MKNFLDALEIIKPSVDEEVEEAYKRLEGYFTTARAKAIKEEKAAYWG